MISTRSPLRISLGGGGTDLPSYYREHGGFLIAGAIDRFVYVNVLRPFAPGVFLKYSKLEHVETIDEVQHPIIREALRLTGFRTPQVEITTLADIPAGTGLGSSGSFTTALLKALYAHRMRPIDPRDLAELACRIEIDILGEPIGKQDQYIAACGGITCFTFNQDGSVQVEPLTINIDTKFDLEDNLLMFFTGFSRSAGSILQDQNTRTQSHDAAMLANLHYVKELGLRSRDLLIEGRTAEFGALMHEHWEHKKRRSGGMSMPQIDEWYELGRRSGAIGGKLVGAGGGGFLLFYAEDRNRLRHAMAHAGLEEVRFRFELEGTKVMYSWLALEILAGGLATRLRPLTETVPKALVEVAGEPFAFHQLRLLARHGFSEAIFLTGYRGEQIAAAVGDGHRFGLDVCYVPDGPTLLGTGGAIARALPHLGDRFAVIYGDSWLDFDYQAAVTAFMRDGRPALMTVFRNEGNWDTSNVELRDGEILVYSKRARTPRMRHIDYGFSLFRADVFRDLPADQPTDLATVFERLAGSGQLAAFEVHQRFYEVGSFAGLAELEARFAEQACDDLR